MPSALVSSALDEVTFLKRECLQLIDSALAICAPNSAGDYPDSFRNVITPFLYAVWERCFTTNFGIMAKLIRETHQTPADLTPQQMALWLKSEPFFSSLSDKLKGQNSGVDSDNPKKAIKGSTYRVLSDFVRDWQSWQQRPINIATETSSLVMTFSNVNLAVLDVNAEAIGLSDFSGFVEFRGKIGLLEDLVGRRNDIGHGTLARPPGNREFRSFVALSKEQLISEFCEVVQTWIAFR